ncbi:glycosyltransferase [Paenibacillus sp. GXUN7292]|uniref:glycosyltransferase n=1 Tax=Paenibacillus sp. GXUN7292 TaxID=3422499 RepID=UPI003D7DB81B
MDFSVLMSVYIKESPKFLEQSLESLLINQTLLPTDIVLVKDGPLTDGLESVIAKYKLQFPDRLNVIGLAENQGLGKALNIGLAYCNCELVARMDSDDISAEHRFETQIKLFEQNKSLDIVGGNIIEFYDTPLSPISERKVPLKMQDIIKMMKRRNPMNHVSVMFKKSAVINAGGYQHLPYLEDYYLWIRMVESNCLMANIDDTLVYVRTGAAMYKRRGNKEYIRGWYTLQKKMKEMGNVNSINVVYNMATIIGFIYMPAGIKELAYKRLLRK